MNELKAWRARTAISAGALLLLALWASRLKAPVMALYLVQTQDVPVLVLLAFSMLIMTMWRPDWRLPSRLPPGWALLLGGLGICALLAWGTYSLMGNYPLSRDEHMVVFDMAVFRKGRLAEPVPAAWQPYALALVPKFLLNSDQPIGLVSAYLPVNAMMRLAFSEMADPAWFNPVLLFLGGIALMDVARRTFGERSRACWVVLLVYVLSAQALVTAMTTYSMTAHLALNLIWLAAFLRGGRLWTPVAILVGFLATGLHQLVFHPVFVAPFLLWKLREGQWRLVLVYAAAYVVIIAWWIYYPIMISPEVARAATGATSANFLTDRVIPLLWMRDPRTIGLMTLNLLRFVSWQNLVLLPLLIAAAPVVVRERGLPAALALGILLWLLFLALVLPEQGRGYGYRYLHPYLGSFALLAGFGYRELEERIGGRADGMVLLMSGLTVVLTIPVLLTDTYRFLQPRLALERLVASQRTPFVLIDDDPATSTDGQWADSALDQVRNLPDFSNRPLRFSGHVLSPSLLARLCSAGPVTLVTRADMRGVGLMLEVPNRSPHFDGLVAAAAAQSPECFRATVWSSMSAPRI